VSYTEIYEVVDMDKRLKECADRLRKLVSNVQGAPYPAEVNSELYTIWYEHIQKNAMDAFEFLDEFYPKEKDDISKTIKGIL